MVPVVSGCVSLLSACAGTNIPVPPSHVASDPYEDMTCDRLAIEKAKRATTQADLNQPPLFPSRSEAERVKELAQIEGEVKAIEKVQSEKRCPASPKKR